MKILEIDYKFYTFPESHPDMEGFMQTVESSATQFIPLIRLLEDNCVPPYFISSESSRCYLNRTKIESIRETEATILSQPEYDRQLAGCVKKTCHDCFHYTHDETVCALMGHRDKLRLDGVCHFKEIYAFEEESVPLL